MTVCRCCCAVEQGYQELELEDGETIQVCAVCESEDIGEVDEDYGSDR